MNVTEILQPLFELTPLAIGVGGLAAGIVAGVLAGGLGGFFVGRKTRASAA